MASYAYYCIHNFHWPPSFFMNLDENERAFVIAAIDVKVDKEIEENKRLKRESKKRR